MLNMPMQTSRFLLAAQYLITIGLCPVLLDGKKPIFNNFDQYLPGPAGSDELALPPERRPLRYNDALLVAWAEAYPWAGLGVLTRERPTIDVDDPQIWEAIRDVVPVTPHVKRGKKGFSLIYSVDPVNPVRRTRTFIERFKKTMLLEVLADGRQTVLPPSIHPETGNPYEWLPMPEWGHMLPVPLNACPPPPLSQAVVDAIEERLSALGLTKRRVERGQGLARGLQEGERRRYEAYLRPKVLERLTAVREAQPGSRQAAVNGAVYALAPWVREGFIGEDELEEEMRIAAADWIREDGDKAFTRQFDKALDEGWTGELPDLDAGRAERLMGAAPLASGSLLQASGPAAIGYSAPVEYWTYDGTLPAEEPELIRRLLPAAPGSLAFVAGKSGMGKSFYTCAMAVALGMGPGTKFFGHPVRECVGTIIVAAENAGGLAARLYAAAQTMGAQGSLPIVVIPRCGNLCLESDRGAMHAALRGAAEHLKVTYGVRVGAVIIDTMLAAFGMEDEGASAEAQKICTYMREMGELLGAVVVPVHHVGKDGAQGMRGSSAYYAAADYVVICGGNHDHETGVTDGRYLAIDKSRNDSTGPVANVNLQVISLGINQYGDNRTTCFYAMGEGPVEPKKRDKVHGLHAAAFDKAYDTIITRNKAKPEDGVPTNELCMQFKIFCHADRDGAKRMAWKRTQETMLLGNRYRCIQDVWFRET